jgi:photosystem II stability/assembly factor-like uncharacterized protein
MRIMRRAPLLLSPVLVLLPSLVFAQGSVGQPGGAPPMINQSDEPLLRPFRWRSIGPVGQGGRVDDIAVVESDPRTFYVAFATGGLWKTTNNGVTFEPIFDTYSTHSIGDVAIAPSNADVLYVGTGEPNNRQSSSFGDGVYKSTDAGRTFTHMGLRETQSIARVVVHPGNSDVVWVAAMGHLFGPNAERGIFKSTDGGRSWSQTLFVDNHTGATDVVIDPSNPDVLFAATYQRQRTTWGFAGGGPGSGIWRSDNGGSTWTRLTGRGLPNGTMGRIALDIARSNPHVLYAQIEVAGDKERTVAQANGGGRPAGGANGGGGGAGMNFRPDPQSSGVWRSNDKGRTWEFLNNHNPRPMYFSQIRVDPTNEHIVYTAGLPLYKSTDAGRSFVELEGFGHVDQHAIWINPANGDHVMIGNDGSVDVSYDQGATWESLRSWAVGQTYHVSVDMRQPYYVCTGLQDNGSWCGPSSVRGGPILSQDWYRIGGGDGFFSAIDPTDWTVGFTESQGGNINRFDLRTGESRSIRPRLRSQSGRGGGGGGGGQGGQPSNIVPEPPAGTQLRFNWSSPFLLSPHNPSIIYFGGNRLFRSYDRGDTWTMTPDLTRQVDRERLEIMGMRGDLPSCTRNTRGQACILSRNDGTSAYGTIVTISESSLVPGLLWVGTDDGAIQVSRDGGSTWSNVTSNLRVPEHYYVSRVEASHHDEGTAYVSLDGHRSDDLKPYLYVTRDFGASWQSITANLPVFGNVNVIKQDAKNRNLLYVGTEFGFYVSLDEGRTWQRLMNNLPVVRIDDVVVHPRDNDLVLATHGRSIWIMDDITPLQQMTPELLAQDAHLFEPRNAVLWKTDIRMARAVTGSKNFRGESAPAGTAISYYLKSAASGEVKITITEVATGQLFRTLDGTKADGLNRVQWNLRGDPPQQGRDVGRGGGSGGGSQGPLATPGVYHVTLAVGGREYTRNVVVEPDQFFLRED